MKSEITASFRGLDMISNMIQLTVLSRVEEAKGFYSVFTVAYC